MMTNRLASSRLLLALLMAAGLALSGCGEARKQLGFDKQAPDEFSVVSRAPLSQPPDYRLRPPQPGAARPQEAATSEQARQSLLGGKAQLKATQPLLKGGRTPGEMSILKKSGADEITPDIRRLVNEETTSMAEADKTFTDKIMFWGKPTEFHEALDPEKENRRIRENQALGKATTEGDTPRIERKRKGLLEDVFK
jgi:hypothetical protein